MWYDMQDFDINSGVKKYSLNFEKLSLINVVILQVLYVALLLEPFWHLSGSVNAGIFDWTCFWPYWSTHIRYIGVRHMLRLSVEFLLVLYAKRVEIVCKYLKRVTLQFF